MTTTYKLTPAQAALLRQIKGGADVFSPAIARDLRALNRTFPGLIEIGEPGGEYGVRDVHPYFGVCLTDAGHAAIKETR